MKHKWAITPLGRHRYLVPDPPGGPVEIHRAYRTTKSSPCPWRAYRTYPTEYYAEAFTLEGLRAYLDQTLDLEVKL